MFRSDCKHKRSKVFRFQTVKRFKNFRIILANMVIISTETYEKICDFYTNFEGLTINCEQKLHETFPGIDSQVLSAILSKEAQKQIKHRHYQMTRCGAQLLREYHQQAEQSGDSFLLQNIAIRERFSPVSLCRILLSIEFEGKPKSMLSEMMKNPHIIPDPLLALNVLNCIFNDKSDGPLTDLKRQSIGQDYEVRMKKMASDAGIEFHDEVHLRRYGFDKTPDLKLARPCMYKGKIINWVESKASFGDMTSHRQYVADQLSSYGNRFGRGIIIYWFGYLDKVATCPENEDIIIVMDEFPKKQDLITMDLPFK